MTAITSTKLAPWGVTRMRPFPAVAVLPAIHPVLNADTQVPDWFDPDGKLAPKMDKHKKSETSKETTTKTSLDGTPDQGSDQNGDSD
ncbi:putative ATP-grasp-modified RiPP [Streptomyces sp. NPDC048179]|uniref:putative ATP-grasp-modified RiPP n=1 Tax=Streptomyces sp. NPDC048179 TaxID=3365506 RepID=UPI00371538FC